MAAKNLADLVERRSCHDEHVGGTVKRMLLSAIFTGIVFAFLGVLRVMRLRRMSDA